MITNRKNCRAVKKIWGGGILGEFSIPLSLLDEPSVKSNKQRKILVKCHHTELNIASW